MGLEKIVFVWSNYGTGAGHFCFLHFGPGAMLGIFFFFFPFYAVSLTSCLRERFEFSYCNLGGDEGAHSMKVRLGF